MWAPVWLTPVPFLAHAMAPCALALVSFTRRRIGAPRDKVKRAAVAALLVVEAHAPRNCARVAADTWATRGACSARTSSWRSLRAARGGSDGTGSTGMAADPAQRSVRVR